MSDFIKVCEEAARAGGEVLLQWQGKINVREKGPRDLVTEADLASQEVIRKILLDAYPNHDFVGEEDSHDDVKSRELGKSDSYRWIVDPLDGTTNFVHQLQTFAVSIALERRGELKVGTVLDPIMNECYSAAASEGAMLNGIRLQTSECSCLNDALIATSFSPLVPRGSIELARFIEVLHNCQALRRLGSAALNLCYVAAGRLDAYWATSVKAWDVAAGVLLVRESGGVVTNIDGGPFDLSDPTFVAAATPSLHDELLSVIARAGEA